MDHSRKIMQPLVRRYSLHQVEPINSSDVAPHFRESCLRKVLGTRHETPVPRRLKNLLRNRIRIPRKTHHRVRRQFSRISQMPCIVCIKEKMHWFIRFCTKHLRTQMMPNLVTNGGGHRQRMMRRVYVNQRTLKHTFCAGHIEASKCESFLALVGRSLEVHPQLARDFRKSLHRHHPDRLAVEGREYIVEGRQQGSNRLVRENTTQTTHVVVPDEALDIFAGLLPC